MSDSWEAIDVNSRGSLTAVSNVDGKTIVRLWADPVTHRLLVDSSGGSGGTFTYYNVSGTIDGINTIFTIPVAPTSDILLWLARQPQMKTTDFTLSGSTITYSVAPDASLSGQPHVAGVIT